MKIILSCRVNNLYTFLNFEYSNYKYDLLNNKSRHIYNFLLIYETVTQDIKIFLLIYETVNERIFII